MVPAVIEVWRWQQLHCWSLRVRSWQHRSWPQCGHTKPWGQRPSVQGVEALVLGSVEGEELVQADSSLELYWIACHVNFIFLS